MYKIDDYVMYRHDVCKIKDIRENKLTGKTYYVMTPIDDESLIIDIPTEDKMGFLRNIISKEDAEKLINSIPSIEPLNGIRDKDLVYLYKELIINTGTHENLIKIIKTTYLRNENRLNNKRKTSEKDSTYFKLAEKYLYNELSISLCMTIDEVKNYIIKVVNESQS